MTLQILEPRALVGRRSVVQRAVIISAIIAGLSCIAAWISAGVSVLLLTYPGIAIRETTLFRYILPFVPGSSFALLVHGPLNYWLRRGLAWTIVAISVQALIWPMLLFSGGSPAVGGLSTKASQSTALVAMHFLIPAIVTGTLLSRYGGPILPFVVSVIGSLLVGRLAVALHATDPMIRIKLGATWLVDVFFSAAFLSLWFAVLAVPWGIPFWRPPIAENKPPDLPE